MIDKSSEHGQSITVSPITAEDLDTTIRTMQVLDQYLEKMAGITSITDLGLDRKAVYKSQITPALQAVQMFRYWNVVFNTSHPGRDNGVAGSRVEE